MIFPIIFVSFLGIFAGILIAKHTKEELKVGIKYFDLIKKSSIIIALTTILHFSGIDYFYQGAIPLITVILLSFSTTDSTIGLVMLTLIFGAFDGKESIFITSASILLFGLAVGSETVYYNEKNVINQALKILTPSIIIATILVVG